MRTQLNASLRRPWTWVLMAGLIALPIFHTNFRADASRPTDITPARQHPMVAKVLATLLTQYHYAHLELNDSVSSALLDGYVYTLDPQRFYFQASDVAAFEKYRFALDDSLIDGEVGPAFMIFNRFKQRSDERLTYVSKLLEKEFDFSVAETIQSDRENAAWAARSEELDELWRKKLKHEALELKLAGKDWPAITENLNKRYANFRKRLSQLNAEDVFQYFMNALSESYDPHTNYFSPITSQNFSIGMSHSFEGIGAQLNTEDEYTIVVEIISGGPADRSKQLGVKDKIIGVAQGDDG
jgi:carboxyl-terminal processing protease